MTSTANRARRGFIRRDDPEIGSAVKVGRHGDYVEPDYTLEKLLVASEELLV
jgi:hypothetical protein